jgi:hypothetical protein
LFAGEYPDISTSGLVEKPDSVISRIGAETSSRDWVKYEIKRSFGRGNGMLGIYLHNIKDFQLNTDTAGDNYFGA